MAIPQLKLDDLTYAQIMEEARALLPSLCPDWTNYNPSDPGIMLLELLAWLTEMVIYQTDQVPEASQWKFLRLLNGRPDPSWLHPPLDDAIRTTIQQLRRRYRAVTTGDYEELVQQSWPASEAAQALGNAAHCARVCALECYNPHPLVPEQATRADQISVIVVPSARYALLQEKQQEQHGLHVQTHVKDYPPGLPRTISVRANWIPAETPISLKLAIPATNEQHIDQGQTSRADESESSTIYPLQSEIYRGKSIVSEGDLWLYPPVRWDIPSARFKASNDWQLEISAPDTAIIGAVEIVLLPPLPSEALCRALWHWLDERRLLTIRHHVTGPAYTPFSVTGRVHLDPDAMLDTVIARAKRAMHEYFDPLCGGPDQRGWPFGRDIYLSEVYDVLGRTPGIDYIADNLAIKSGDQISDVETLPSIQVDRHALVYMEEIVLTEDVNV